MKKLLLVLLLVCLTLLVACGSDKTPETNHTHAWSDWNVTKAATCTEDGTRERACACGEIEKGTVVALGHAPGVEPTCTTAQVCTMCNAVLIVAKGHTPGSEATCTTTQSCTSCNAVLVAAQGHTPGVGATCTMAQTCTACNAELASAKGHTPGAEATCTTSQFCTTCNVELIAANGHTEVIDEAVAPTCTQTGLTEGKHCSVCSKVLVPQNTVATKDHTLGAEATCTTAQICTVCHVELVAAKGHTEVVDEAVAPTCTQTGLTEGKHCSVCSKVLVPQNTVATKDHTLGAEATCTTAQTCTVCHVELVAAKGHTEVVDEAVAPTCAQMGLTEGKHCSICSKVLVPQNTVATKDHTPGAQPTCTTAQACTVCNAELAAAKGHTPGAEATCTAAQTCTVCNAELAAAIGHTPGAEATCIMAQTCTVCDVELVAAKGHTLGAEATCTTAQACINCNAVLVAAKGHTPGAEATCATAQTCTSCDAVLVVAKGHTPGAEATCTTAQVCTVCSAELIAAKGHSEVVDEAVAPTCTQMGLTEGKHCSACSEILVAQDTVVAKGHTPGVEPTCTSAQACTSCNAVLVAAKGHTPGAEATCATAQTCTSCDAVLVVAKGHTPGAWATCTRAQICTACNAVLVAAKGHNEVIDRAVTPTITESGLTEGKHCSVCNKVLVAQKVLPATGSIGLIYRLNDKRDAYIVTSIGACKDSAVYIPEVYNGHPVTEIASSAFSECLTMSRITIPASIKKISSSAFSGCTGLTKISVEVGNPVYHSNGNCLIETESKTLILGCWNSMIPKDGSVTSIGNSAFSGCTGLTSIVIPYGVKSIGNAAFSGCTGLTSIFIPYGVKNIGQYAFKNCTGLTSVVIPHGVTNIYDYTFFGCTGLTSVVLPDSVTTIGQYAFQDCKSLTSIVIPDRVTYIGYGVFTGCIRLTSIVIPDGAPSISMGSFYGCIDLTSIVIPDSVVHIGDSAFSNCSGLTDVYYTGTEAEWRKILIVRGNDYLTSATIHYNYVPN